MKKTLMIISSIIFYLIGIIILGFYLYLEVAPKVSMDELDRIILLFLLALFFYLGSLLLSKYLKNNKPMKFCLYFIFVLYLITLIKLTLFDRDYGRVGLNFFNWNKENIQVYLRNNNLIPFKTIIEYIVRQDRVALINLFGNVIAFAPMGLFLPLLFNKQKKTFFFILTNIIIVLVIEILQFLSLSGSFDIDDLILNIGGALIVYGLYKIKKINKLINKVFLIKKEEQDNALQN